jgi:hypothetical protein
LDDFAIRQRGQRLEAVSAPGREDGVRASRVQQPRGRRPDAGRGARDDDDGAGEVTQVHPAILPPLARSSGQGRHDRLD